MPTQGRGHGTANVSRLLLCLAFVLFCGAASLEAADWPTFRGNMQRTGNVDGQPGPLAPKVLWTLPSTDHFLAAPALCGESAVVAGLGAQSTSHLLCLNFDPAAKERTRWEKAPNYLQQAVVSSPSTVGETVVFGNGLHVDSGAVLHGLNASSGVPLWQYKLAGPLVHLEGGPTLHEGRVYIGGGNAGVLCFDPAKLTLEGRPIEASAVVAELEKRWNILQAKFEDDKKNKSEFAVPPSEASLPRAQPALVWQQGEKRLHVDAAVAVAGDRVFAPSAHLDAENSGERAVVCLNRADGAVTWLTPLRLNPLGGISVAGDLVLVACSSIRFDPRELVGAKGEVVALSAADGAEKWKVALPGGVLGGVAVHNGLALCAASDGKVRALDLATGQKKWIYDAKAPFFAGVAVAGDLAYMADLRGIVHAIGLADGRAKWTLDLAADPAVKAPGMVYGSPLVHGGRLLLATCNVEAGGGKSTVVVCIGEK